MCMNWSNDQYALNSESLPRIFTLGYNPSLRNSSHVKFVFSSVFSDTFMTNNKGAQIDQMTNNKGAQIGQRTNIPSIRL